MKTMLRIVEVILNIKFLDVATAVFPPLQAGAF